MPRASSRSSHRESRTTPRACFDQARMNERWRCSTVTILCSWWWMPSRAFSPRRPRQPRADGVAGRSRRAARHPGRRHRGGAGAKRGDGHSHRESRARHHAGVDEADVRARGNTAGPRSGARNRAWHRRLRRSRDGRLRRTVGDRPANGRLRVSRATTPRA
jgi:hypothetical protein